MNLSRLEGFFWVARCESYAEAARRFPYPITQPGVFQQVKKLEAELGEPLFERAGKDRVRLTPAGGELFRFCAPFFVELPAVIRSIRARSFGGELRIDGAGLTIRGLLPLWIRRLRAERPDIKVALREVATPDPDRLRTGDADLLVDYLPKLPSDVASRRVGTAHAFLAIPDDHRLARRRRLTVDALGEDSFISYPPGTKHHEIQLAALGQSGVTPRRTLAASTVDSILRFVQAGLGYSLIPWLDEKGLALPGVVVRRQRGATSRFPILAAWRASPRAHPLVDAALRVAPPTPRSARRFG